jgi:hypothetical protein
LAALGAGLRDFLAGTDLEAAAFATGFLMVFAGFFEAFVNVLP